MTRAEEGALVNLRKSDKPQDMYSAVAEGVVADLKAAGDPDGLLTLSIDRKLLKRPVMTWPYNASDFGTNKEIRETLEERGAKIPVSPRITASDLLRPGAPSLYGCWRLLSS